MRDGNLVPTGEATITDRDHDSRRAWANALALHLTDAATWGRLTLTPGVRVELIETCARDRLAGLEVAGPPQRVVIPGHRRLRRADAVAGVCSRASTGGSRPRRPQSEHADGQAE